MYNDVRPSARRLVAVEIGTFDCVIDLPRINDLGIERAVPVRHLEDDGGMRKPRKGIVKELQRRAATKPYAQCVAEMAREGGGFLK